MTDPEDARVKAHYSVTADTYRDHYDPANLRRSRLYPAEYFRLRTLLMRLRAIGAKKVLDAGCGEGTPLVRMAGIGAEVRGFDFTPEMVERAKENLAENGLDPAWAIVGDIERYESFEPLAEAAPFDAAVCFGVMPHVSDDVGALTNLRRVLEPNGRVFVEFRNALFNLFTMNRYTHGFILSDLLSDAPESIRSVTERYLRRVLAMDKPAPRNLEEGGQPGYDAIRARMHNPLTVGDTFKAAGYRLETMHWYHFHPTLPLLEGNGVPTADFREAAFRMEESPDDWRGHFLCSAFVAEATAR